MGFRWPPDPGAVAATSAASSAADHSPTCPAAAAAVWTVACCPPCRFALTMLNWPTSQVRQKVPTASTTFLVSLCRLRRDNKVSQSKGTYPCAPDIPIPPPTSKVRMPPIPGPVMQVFRLVPGGNSREGAVEVGALEVVRDGGSLLDIGNRCS